MRTIQRTSKSLALNFPVALLLVLAGFAATGAAQSLGTFTPTGNMTTVRRGHTATLLRDGRVLIAGGNQNRPASAELYDPATGIFTATGDMTMARSGHSATLLPDGKVLIAGGAYGPPHPETPVVLPDGKMFTPVVSDPLPDTELYDPSTRTFTRTGDMVTLQSGPIAVGDDPFGLHRATLLNNGKVLIAGGVGMVDGYLTAANPELYDPATGTFTVTGGYAATGPQNPYGSGEWGMVGAPNTLLPNGKVLIAGEPTAELYDPVTDTFSLTGAMTTHPYGATPWYIAGRTATLLTNGRVLLAGGAHEDLGYFDNAELYEPLTGIFTDTGHMTARRQAQTATLLRDGTVLITGGWLDSGPTASAELYNSGTGTFSATGDMTSYRSAHTATLLNNGQVLIAGGYNIWGNPPIYTSSAELYTPSSNSSLLATRFVPIVLSLVGAGGVFYTSEITLANRSARPATLEFTYRPAFGAGSGQATDTLEPGRQRIIPDAISYLRGIGIPISESGNRGGTLQVRVSGLPSPHEVAIVARTSTVVAGGRAGLAYPGVPLDSLLEGPAYLPGLRQDLWDRTNVALQNAGETADGDITLRLTVYSGDPLAPFSQILPDIVISPGGFHQINGILHSNGLALSNGYVRIERVGGTVPYYAYAVINDQSNSDGSFVPPVAENSLVGRTKLTLPVVVEANGFVTELVASNWSSVKKTLNCTYVSDAIATPDSSATFSIELNPQEQRILPDFVQWLRNSKVPGVGPRGPSFMGALFAEVTGNDMTGVSLAARTSVGGLQGGRYGLFYTAIPNGSASATSAWIYGLQQNAETRSSLALVNTGETDASADVFRIELFEGGTGRLANTLEIIVRSKGWTQIGSILAQHAPGTTQGYARVTRIAGNNPFIAYAVLNDGGQPGERTGDGAFVASAP